jgi:hypothetical protein
MRYRGFWSLAPPQDDMTHLSLGINERLGMLIGLEEPKHLPIRVLAANTLIR